MIESLWILEDIRRFFTAHQTALLVYCGIFTIVAQGLVHGAFYARGKHSFIDVHGASEALGATHYLTLYVAGLDPIEAFGATLIGTFFFQMLINVGSGLPPIDPNEKRRYEAGGVDMTWKRWAVGYWRFLKLALGIALIFYEMIVSGLL